MHLQPVPPADLLGYVLGLINATIAKLQSGSPGTNLNRARHRHQWTDHGNIIDQAATSGLISEVEQASLVQAILCYGSLDKPTRQQVNRVMNFLFNVRAAHNPKGRPRELRTFDAVTRVEALATFGQLLNRPKRKPENRQRKGRGYMERQRAWL